jgi:hypothetical protein
MIDSYNSSDESIGLLRKLIIKYVQECYYSSAKFWPGDLGKSGTHSVVYA